MSDFKDLDQLLQKYVDDGLPGCGMIICKKGEVLYEITADGQIRKMASS